MLLHYVFFTFEINPLTSKSAIYGRYKRVHVSIILVLLHGHFLCAVKTAKKDSFTYSFKTSYFGRSMDYGVFSTQREIRKIISYERTFVFLIFKGEKEFSDFFKIQFGLFLFVDYQSQTCFVEQF